MEELDFVSVDVWDGTPVISFFIEDDSIMEIGNKLNEICEDAYMHGENWGNLLEAWLEENEPDILDGLDRDAEAGTYGAYFDPENDGLKKAERFAEIIKELVNDPEKLYDFVRENGEDIEWD